MLERDYLMRMIAALGSARARIAALSRGGKPRDADAELSAAFSALLGVSRTDAQRLAPSSLVMMIGKERAETAAKLYEAEADLATAEGDLPRAEARSARALAVRRAASA